LLLRASIAAACNESGDLAGILLTPTELTA